MKDRKPKFFATNDHSGMFIWISRDRPTLNPESKTWECEGAPRLRLPKSFFEYLFPEGGCVVVPIEETILQRVESKNVIDNRHKTNILGT